MHPAQGVAPPDGQPFSNSREAGACRPDRSSAAQAPGGALGPGPRTTLKRHPERGQYDRQACYAIMDEALLCHVAFNVETHPALLPMAFAREGDNVYLHGARANRMLAALVGGSAVSLAFTLLDGLVFARTAFYHSMNYRSVIAFGQAFEVSETERKRHALALIVDHAAPGRSAELPAMSDAELRATRVLRVEVQEASAKQRQGPAFDTPEGMAAEPGYAAVIPLALRAAAPVRDARLSAEQVPSQAVLACALRLGAPPIFERYYQGDVYSSDPARLDLTLVHRFLSEESYWARGVERERLDLGFARSICFGVYRDGRQVAFARAVSDGARFAYLADVFVVASARGQGLGTRLVQYLLEHPWLRDVSRLLLGTRDAAGFYQALGFREIQGVSWLRREQIPGC